MYLPAALPLLPLIPDKKIDTNAHQPLSHRHVALFPAKQQNGKP